MNVNEMEENISNYMMEENISNYMQDCDTPFFTTPSVFCIHCRTISRSIVMDRPDKVNSHYDNSFYRKVSYLLLKKFAPNPPTTNFTWFCSIKCLVKMIYENQDYLLEELTK